MDHLFSMRTARIVFLVMGMSLIVAGVSALAVSAQANLPAISVPLAGEVLQGVITISGTSQVGGFASAEIAFSYHADPTATWFQIATGNQPVEDGTLATWDTTGISDGVYDLRLRVHLADGKILDAVTEGVRVRNYTPIETPTPTPVIPAATPLPTATLTATPYPTPTALPPNPAALTAGNVLLGVGFGGLGVILLAFILGLYLRLRRKVP